MQSFAVPFTREVRPTGFGAQSVGRELVRVAQEGHKQLSVALGQWEMLIAYFKHGLEIPLCLDPLNTSLREQHRTILTAAMSLGEVLNGSGLKDEQLRSLGYSREFVAANLRYLRDTYQTWYVEKDKDSVEADFLAICNACANAPAGNS